MGREPDLEASFESAVLVHLQGRLRNNLLPGMLHADLAAASATVAVHCLSR